MVNLLNTEYELATLNFHEDFVLIETLCESLTGSIHAERQVALAEHLNSLIISNTLQSYLNIVCINERIEYLCTILVAVNSYLCGVFFRIVVTIIAVERQTIYAIGHSHSLVDIEGLRVATPLLSNSIAR